MYRVPTSTSIGMGVFGACCFERHPPYTDHIKYNLHNSTISDWYNSQPMQQMRSQIRSNNPFFEGMSLDRFKWAGVYFPVYPEPWASTQIDLPKFHKSATYLGWNGQWELEFSVPIFTWIHKLENLGWIYD